MLNKLNLGGPGNGMNQGLGAGGGGVMQSINFGGANDGGLGSIASSARVDKSMDNLNLGALKQGGQFGGLKSNINNQSSQYAVLQLFTKLTNRLL